MQKIQDDQQYIKNTKSQLKMQGITDNLASTTPDLTKFINPEALLKPTKMQIEQQNKKSDPNDSKNKKKQIQQSTVITKNEMTAQDWILKCQELQAILEKEKMRTNQLELELKNRQERFVNREIEYRKTIEALQTELRAKTALDQGDRKIMENIYKDHNKIIDGINNIQLRTSKILVDQERDIIRFFNNKINEIKKQFEEERIKKGKNDQEYIEKENQLISELEWIKNIAQKIDNENHSLMQKYKELKIQYQTQENDREMLLKELIMKKKKNAILKSQIEQYEKLLNEAQKDEVEQDDQSFDQPSYQDIVRPGSKAKVRIRSVKNSSQSQNRQNKDDSLSKNQSQIQQQQQQGSQSIQQTLQRYEKTIKSLQSTLKKEQKRVRDLKQLYIKEMQSKSELEVILRKCIDDIKEEIIQIKGEARIFNKNNKNKLDQLEKEDRDKLIQTLLDNEKIVTLIHDQIFYANKKKVDELNTSKQYEPKQQKLFQFPNKQILQQQSQQRQLEDEGFDDGENPEDEF
ncbi:unnamed protein product (macronuclear) [Paramecium tetraurelia]|uniref:Growth arrest-specific protein 8 domain-containing protein n=1 Tax=Paramecium tetraurelia TaxID=5888 RepID=A0DZC1_PARTE|nr:uncharacterized protein GSPATT00003357001 [Paramecium tetraurelia]CAK88388.1 unnamed protein product [Paramecium tetraurelia]|eukprot:XP_001455785.1 hypothetical protein (macronuclear) [Paramecium tetraurelia strain d4-2]